MSLVIDLVEISDLTTRPQVFKNPNWRSPTRRHKPLKNLLSDEQKRINLLNQDPDKKANFPNNVNYFSIQAPPSLKPGKNYCDITGLPSNYKAPSSGLKFYNLEVYEIVKNMTAGIDQQYLALRNANVVLR
ncbi:hypothetical protein PACTADRAFT_69874 [Pachysolen tannophilus NRRL Y-2460]|uniref:Vps72/YL1 C-terminal domain-containing protein n=1 Tax=Pachysolen tannophilus NRRL Y-2460 TaxID=669874 RepID=A0A1E4TST7_PACTA|nr:hypothetical protein PACTADRAFT_69874 [Pachysolen tannophilus NRRL Y-2460]